MDKMMMQDFISKVNKSDTRRRLIPMEMGSGWPSLSIKNKQICVTIPYFRTQSGEDGKVFVFPLSYILTVTWPNAAVVEFTSLRYKKEYNAIDFGKPAGTFKHEAVKDMNKDEYRDMRKSLFELYDELIECITDKKDFLGEKEFSQTLSVLMEPSLLPMYMHIAPKFFGSYCHGKEIDR